MGSLLPDNVSSTSRGQEVFTTVSAATHHHQLSTWLLMHRLIIGHVRGGILALLLGPILSPSLGASMPKSHSVLHRPTPVLPLLLFFLPPFLSESRCELMHATEAVTSVVYCLVGRSSL